MQTTQQPQTCPVCKGSKTVKQAGKDVLCQHCRGTGQAGKLQTK